MKDKQVRSDEARRTFRDLLNEVEHHDVHVTILRYDKPTAVLVSPDWYDTVTRYVTATATSCEAIGFHAREREAGNRPLGESEKP
jgi:hypothetical protein